MGRGWENSDRRERLPSNWWAISQAVKRRDRGICQECGQPGTDVDHISPSGPDEEWNLQLLCPVCHGKKSAAEGNAARAKLRALTKRPKENHPGWIPPRERKAPERRGF